MIQQLAVHAFGGRYSFSKEVTTLGGLWTEEKFGCLVFVFVFSQEVNHYTFYYLVQLAPKHEYTLLEAVLRHICRLIVEIITNNKQIPQKKNIPQRVFLR